MHRHCHRLREIGYEYQDAKYIALSREFKRICEQDVTDEGQFPNHTYSAWH